jgi:hypothetical protein
LFNRRVEMEWIASLMPGDGPFRQGRYRLRTWLRIHEPGWLYDRWPVPKGSEDCGNHQFYNVDDAVERCYHCEAGLRPRPANPTERTSTIGEGIA